GEGCDRRLLECARPRHRVVTDLGEVANERRCFRLVDARDKNVLTCSGELAGDADDLFRGLPLPQNNLGDALTKGWVMVDRRKTELGERQLAQLGDGLFYVRTAALYAHEQFCQASFVHAFSLAQAISVAPCPCRSRCPLVFSSA